MISQLFLEHRKSFLALLLWALVPCFAQAQMTHAVVNVPVANMFSAPSAQVDVVSQTTFGRNIDVLSEEPKWVKIETPADHYTGWVKRSDLIRMGEASGYAISGPVAVVEELAAHLYPVPDLTKRAPSLTVPFETRLEVAKAIPGHRWILVKLPDGNTLWVQRGDITLYPDAANVPKGDMSVKQMIAFSRRFLGLPYTWGGRSSFGYDCSGFVQMLMGQRGYSLPRDADQQAAWSGFEPANVHHLKAGDVLFFGDKGKITHTGMYIGHNKFIDATTYEHPVIQIDKFNPYWHKALICARRVKP